MSRWLMVAALMLAGCGGDEAVAPLPPPPEEIVPPPPPLPAMEVPLAYLVQSVQRAGDIPLIAGRRALLRVFVTTQEKTAHQPKVTIRSGGIRLTAKRPARPLPHSVNEADLGNSFNVVVPGSLVRGIPLTVEVDGVERLTLAPMVVSVPVSGLTIVPVQEAHRPTRPISSWTDTTRAGIIPHAMPFEWVPVTVRETYTTSLDLTVENNVDNGHCGGPCRLLGELEVLRHMGGDNGDHWYGAVARSETRRIRANSWPNGWVSMGKAFDNEMAHEIGHNLGFRHTECSIYTNDAPHPKSVDPGFPHAGGVIGVLGYDWRDSTLVMPEVPDIMGYCYSDERLTWLSDYHYEKALARRNRLGLSPPAMLPAQDVLVLGGAVAEGRVILDTPFISHARPKLPDAGGPYRLEGHTPDGLAFSLAFTPTPLAHGGASFLFMVPSPPELSRVVLGGPGGSVAIDTGDRETVTVVTDPATGHIRAILRNWSGPVAGETRTTRGLREVRR